MSDDTKRDDNEFEGEGHRREDLRFDTGGEGRMINEPSAPLNSWVVDDEVAKEAARKRGEERKAKIASGDVKPGDVATSNRQDAGVEDKRGENIRTRRNPAQKES